jgi:EAL domain-containing protein (putative c-di-GMP-specific phosphodiesterase class I)
MNYQPIIATQKTDIEFYEVLLRMQLDEGDDVLPQAFFPAAERLGLASDIDCWIIRNAIRKIAECNSAERSVSLAINLSNNIFEAKDLLEKVKRYINQYEIDPSQLYFEINEPSVLRQMDSAKSSIEELVALGCHFTLEHFGSVPVSYNYLKKLPIEIIKIDGDYIENMINDPVDQAVVRSMVQIAKTLNKRTMVEYIEDASTLEMIKSFGVDYVQGYYFGEPKINIDAADYSQAVSKLESNVVRF